MKNLKEKTMPAKVGLKRNGTGRCKKGSKKRHKAWKNKKK